MLVLTAVVQLHERQLDGAQRVGRRVAVDAGHARQRHEGLTREVIRRQHVAVPHRQRQRRARPAARLQRHAELEALVPHGVQRFLDMFCFVSTDDVSVRLCSQDILNSNSSRGYVCECARVLLSLQLRRE